MGRKKRQKTKQKKLLHVEGNKYLIFAFGGLSIFLYELLVTIVLTEFFHVWYMYSYAIALISGLAFLFFYHAHITFKKLFPIVPRVKKFTATYAATYLLAWLLVLTVTRLGLHYLISIVVISILLSFANYHLHRTWVFEDAKN